VKTLSRRYEEVEGGKPVRAKEENMGEISDTPHVGENRPRFYHVDETNQSVRLEES